MNLVTQIVEVGLDLLAARVDNFFLEFVAQIKAEIRQIAPVSLAGVHRCATLGGEHVEERIHERMQFRFRHSRTTWTCHSTFSLVFIFLLRVSLRWRAPETLWLTPLFSTHWPLPRASRRSCRVVSLGVQRSLTEPPHLAVYCLQRR